MLRYKKILQEKYLSNKDFDELLGLKSYLTEDCCMQLKEVSIL